MTAVIVVDLGCAAHGQWDSPHWLEERFHPETIYGFDPTATPGTYTLNKTEVIVEDKAAWLTDGHVWFQVDGTASCIVENDEPLLPPHMWRDPDGLQVVPCIDFRWWLEGLAKPVTVKMDCEGAEFALLERLLVTDTIRWVELLLMEWHAEIPETRIRRDSLLERLPCPIENWDH